MEVVEFVTCIKYADIHIHIMIYICMCIYIYIYIHSIEQSNSFHLVKKFPEFYGNRRFITAFNCPPPVPTLSQIDPVHVPHPTS